MPEDLGHDVQPWQKAGQAGPRRLTVSAGEDTALRSDPVRSTESRPPERRIRTSGALGLSVAALALAFVTFRAFDPGFMSPDSLDQYLQATGRNRVTDWHPPVLMLLWRVLLNVTAQPSSLLALQLIFYWGSLLTIALVLLRRSGSWPWALVALGVGCLPNLLTFAGVIWKDVHLALVLIASIALVMVAEEVPRRRAFRLVLIAASVILLAYAVLVRKNALVALPPIIYALYLGFTGPQRRLRFLLGWVVAIAVVAGMGQVAITTLIRPLQGHQFASIAVDDISHVSAADDIRASGLSVDLQARLLRARVDCAQKHVLMNSYLSCYDYQPGGPVPVPNAAELQHAWPRLMLRQPGGYVKYRTQLFVNLLVHPREFWGNGVMENSEGLKVAHPGLAELLRRYVVELGVGNFGFLFSGVTWFVGATYLAFRRRRGYHGTLVRCLGLSALLYILAYWPFTPANDFRYLYWSAFAVAIGVMLSLHDRYAMGARVESRSRRRPFRVWLRWRRGARPNSA